MHTCTLLTLAIKSSRLVDRGHNVTIFHTTAQKQLSNADPDIATVHLYRPLEATQGYRSEDKADMIWNSTLHSPMFAYVYSSMTNVFDDFVNEHAGKVSGSALPSTEQDSLACGGAECGVGPCHCRPALRPPFLCHCASAKAYAWRSLSAVCHPTNASFGRCTTRFG